MPASWSEAFDAIKQAVSKASPDRIGAIAGDLATVEEMYALKLLMQSLGSENIDCRQDGTALDPALGRASYIFNTTIEGIEQADAVLIIGANPRFEASVLNARIRKRWKQGNLPVGVIGEVGDIRYDYQQLGAGPETLKALADGSGTFFETLKAATHPLIIVGQGAISRSDGAAILGQAAKLAQAVNAVREDWNGFSVLHTAAARVGGLDVGFVPGKGGKDAAGMLGETDVLFLLGADEIDMTATGGAFVVYIGTHGDAGAHRANVILPGAAYTEKSGTYVNTEGRVQQASRAGFAPGEAKEDWAILRALSDVLGKKLPFEFACPVAQAALWRLSASLPRRRDRAGQCRGPRQGRAPRRAAEQGRLHLTGEGFLPHQPDRARLGRHGRMFGASEKRLQAGGGIGRWKTSSSPTSCRSSSFF